MKELKTLSTAYNMKGLRTLLMGYRVTQT